MAIFEFPGGPAIALSEIAVVSDVVPDLASGEGHLMVVTGRSGQVLATVTSAIRESPGLHDIRSKLIAAWRAHLASGAALPVGQPVEPHRHLHEH